MNNVDLNYLNALIALSNQEDTVGDPTKETIRIPQQFNAASKASFSLFRKPVSKIDSNDAVKIIPRFKINKIKPNLVEDKKAKSTSSTKPESNKENQNWLDKTVNQTKKDLRLLTNLYKQGVIQSIDTARKGSRHLIDYGRSGIDKSKKGFQRLAAIGNSAASDVTDKVLEFADNDAGTTLVSFNPANVGLAITQPFNESPKPNDPRPYYAKPAKDLDTFNIPDFNNSYSELSTGLPKVSNTGRSLENIIQNIDNVYPGFYLGPSKLYGTMGNLESIAKNVLNSSANAPEDVGEPIAQEDTESIPDTTVTSGVVVGPETNNVSDNNTPTVNSVAKSITSKQKSVSKAAPKSTSKINATVNSAPVVAAPTNTIPVQSTAQVTAPSLDSIMQQRKQAYANYQNQVRQSAIDAFNRSGYGNPLDALRNGAISQGQFKIIANGY